MAANKTIETDASVQDCLVAIADDARREDCRALVAMMSRATGQPPRMWGAGIVGFGSYHYRYESGREGDAPLTGFAARKGDISVYIVAGFEAREALLARLGRHRSGKACLYLRSLADVDMDVLEQLVAGSVAQVRGRYPSL
ncbi:MAG: DUF1801 domain-containing protein [Luteimonas sp.]|nr:DUF1801 domain-containing protein [Luteimonas sp.]